MKLTKARRDMLEQLRKEPGHYAPYYPPMKWAIENDLVELTGREHSGIYRLTEAGRDALAAAS